VDRGNIPYSAVTQPLPEFRIQGGTLASTVALHSTCVFPNLTKHEPSAYGENPVLKTTDLISSGERPEGRIGFPFQELTASYPTRVYW
jgi:hypothetical protein